MSDLEFAAFAVGAGLLTMFLIALCFSMDDRGCGPTEPDPDEADKGSGA